MGSTPLLKNIPSIEIIKLLSYYDSKFHLVGYNYEEQLKVLKIWINNFPKYIHSKIITIVLNNQKNIAFFNSVTTLNFIQYCLANFNDLPNRNITFEDELNIFKAYIYFSEQINSEIEKKTLDLLSEQKMHLSAEDILLNLNALQFQQQDFIYTSEVYLQGLKTYYFLEFCKKNTDYNQLILDFTKSIGLSNYVKYFSIIFKIYNYFLKNQKNLPTIIEFSPNEIDEIKLFNSISINIKEFKEDPDFIYIRNNPVFKLGYNSYLILNYNLLIEKIFKNLKFTLANFVFENKYLFKNIILKERSQFFTIYSTDFSEKELFVPILEEMFGKTGHSYSGDYLKSQGISAEPDYLFAMFRDVFVFEFKDVTLSNIVKFSLNFDTLKKDLYKKFYQNDNNKKKGIKQILQTFNKINTGKYDSIIKTGKKQFNKFYPILVLTDNSYLNNGTLQYLNYLLQKDLEENQYEFKVFPLIIIQLETLIRFLKKFKYSQISFINECKNYINEYENKMQNINTPSFDDYINGKYKSKPLIHIEYLEMLKCLC